MSTKQKPGIPEPASLTTLIGQIAEVVQRARGHVRQSVNQAMVASYWEIGRLIVEHEQQGQARAAYGQRQLAELSARLTELFGKGFGYQQPAQHAPLLSGFSNSRDTASRIELDALQHAVAGGKEAVIYD